MYVTVASLAAGVTVSAIRWAVFNTLHHRTGVAPPRWDFATLPEKLEAYQALIEIHYRYYQLHAPSPHCAGVRLRCEILRHALVGVSGGSREPRFHHRECRSVSSFARRPAIMWWTT